MGDLGVTSSESFFKAHRLKNKASNKMPDKLTEQLTDLTGDIPEPRRNLSEQEKDELIKKVGGPNTASAIINASKDFPKRRIPWIFSTINSQWVVDLLSNDMSEAILRSGKSIRK